MDWEYSRKLCSDEYVDSPHLFLEKLIAGPEKIITHHLIIPTQFGMFYDFLHLSNLTRAFDSCKIDEQNWHVIIRQEECMSRCCTCLEEIEMDERLPYQVALRVIGTMQLHTRDWIYDILICMVCRTCATTTWKSLILIDYFHYVPLCKAILEFGFKHKIDIVPSEETLSDIYMRRYAHLNTLIPDVIERTLFHGHHYCQVCRKIKTRKNNVKQCDGCHAVYFCEGHCKNLAMRYHDTLLCKELQLGRLFHVDQAYSVSHDGSLVTQN